MNTPIHSLRISTWWDGRPAPGAHHIEVEWVEGDSSVELRVDAPHYGDPLPPQSPAGPTDGLWNFEVVEVFVAGSDERYTEIEMSPSGHHLVLQLDGIRTPVATCIPIEFRAQIDGERWRGVARIDRALLPPQPWRVNATSIHGSGADRRYLSMVPLPGSAPDFHQPSQFQRLS